MAKRARVNPQTEWEARQRERETRWRRHVDAWRASGTSQAAYCRKQGLTPAQFSWWKHELARRAGQCGSAEGDAQGGTEPPRFVPLRVTAERMPDGCELELRDGRRLRIGSGVDPRWVVELAAALERNAPC
jgi:hypothetical protein